MLTNESSSSPIKGLFHVMIVYLALTSCFRRMRKPFYRQLYEGLRDVDTFNVAGCITASIMY